MATFFGMAHAQYTSWSHMDSLFILTTPEGANIPAGVVETGFPLLVRLDKDFFTFADAKANGDDIRFSTPSGIALPYQIEEWDGVNGKASIWVRIPTVNGNARQAIRMYWGNAGALSESNGKTVFTTATGFLSVLHLSDPANPAKDEVGTLTPVNNGTTNTAGAVGNGRNFAAKQGIKCGTNIAAYPSGPSPHSTEGWFRAKQTGNSTMIGWGKEGGSAGKIRMMWMSPSYIRIDSDGGSFDSGNKAVPTNQWVHVVETYKSGDARLYINGKLDGQTTTTMNIVAPVVGFWIGGWLDGYDYVGDIDEVRISNVSRSADWVKMEYENQNPLQSLAGLLVPAGTTFSVPQTTVSVLEGHSISLTGNAGGAQKIYWILKEGAKETILAVDRLSLAYMAERVTADKTVILQFKAVYPTEVKTQDITLTIKEDMPDPLFTLTAPATWNGRDAISLTPVITNQAEMTAKGVGALTYTWDIANIAVIKDVTPGKLTLKRAQKSGKMTVYLSISNGGSTTVHSVDITVTQPATDPWLVRTPAADEKAENSQFYARDPNNVCTTIYNGTLANAADSVFVKIYSGTTLQKREAHALATSRTYAFSPTLAPALTEYKLEFGSKTGATESLVSTVTNLVCGDAYIVEGQSNAEATQFGTDDNPATSEYIRTYGSMGDNPGSGWHNAAHLGTGQVGYWGMEVARILMTKYSIPICIINGAVGGTRIDLHQRNDANQTDVNTIYGRLLSRIQGAKLTHGIKAVMWHQGENDQGSEAPTGRMDWETYQPYFFEMSADWKENFPNIQHYYLFQIWPAACGGMTGGSESILREMQRSLPSFYSNMDIMSTLGVRPGSSCHYSAAGYQDFARLLTPLLERDFYGKTFTTSITASNVVKTYFTSSAKNEIAVEFDQPVTWNTSLASQFYLDGASGKISGGTTTGNILTLSLNAASTATKITYLDSRSWSETNILYGANNIAALTFWNVPVYPDKNTVPNFSKPKLGHANEDISARIKNGSLLLSLGRLYGQSLDIEIVNLQGQTLLKNNVKSGYTSVVQLAVPQLKQGVYIIKVSHQGQLDLMRKLTAF